MGGKKKRDWYKRGGRDVDWRDGDENENVDETGWERLEQTGKETGPEREYLPR